MYCDKDIKTAFVFERITCFNNETRVLIVLIYASLKTGLWDWIWNRNNLFSTHSCFELNTPFVEIFSFLCKCFTSVIYPETNPPDLFLWNWHLWADIVSISSRKNLLLSDLGNLSLCMMFLFILCVIIISASKYLFSVYLSILYCVTTHIWQNEMYPYLSY